MQEQLNQWIDLNQNVFTTAYKFANISKNLMLGLTRQQMDIIGIYMESGVKQIQALSDINQFHDVLAAQSGLAEKFNRNLANNLRTTVEILVDSKNQLTEWMNDVLEEINQLTPTLKPTVQ